MKPGAQHQAGSAQGEGRAAYVKGLSISDALAQSYYANHAPMIAGAYHVAQGFADAARDAGASVQVCAGYVMAGHNYRCAPSGEQSQ